MQNFYQIRKSSLDTVFSLIGKALIIFGCIELIVYCSLRIFSSPLSAVVSWVVFFYSLFMIVHGCFTLFFLLYAWDDPFTTIKNKSPFPYEEPAFSFTALIPARHEELVIGQTISSIANINYPKHLKEILVICRTDDDATIQKAQEKIDSLGDENIKLVTFSDSPINKPHALNVGLSYARNTVIAVFDAEDEPHPDIYNIVNTVMLKENPTVVQSGVQLVNFQSRWFSALNILEYYFWFKSSLHFFSKAGVVPLGGNTVFIKNQALVRMGGWDETLLTEDADLGIRLSVLGERIRVIYDEQHATLEETPSTVGSLIRQRSRWNQGFLQVFFKGDWNDFSRISQKFLIVYILLSAQLQTLFLLYFPISLYLIFFFKLPVLITLFASIPAYILFLQLIVYTVGLYEFIKLYNFRFSSYLPFWIVLTYIPYQLLLGYSALRALFRFLVGRQTWEKTVHINAHREFQIGELYS